MKLIVKMFEKVPYLTTNFIHAFISKTEICQCSSYTVWNYGWENKSTCTNKQINEILLGFEDIWNSSGFYLLEIYFYETPKRVRLFQYVWRALGMVDVICSNNLQKLVLLTICFFPPGMKIQHVFSEIMQAQLAGKHC